MGTQARADSGEGNNKEQILGSPTNPNNTFQPKSMFPHKGLNRQLHVGPSCHGRYYLLIYYVIFPDIFPIGRYLYLKF